MSLIGTHGLTCNRRWLDDGRRSEEGRDVPGGRDGCIEIAGLSVTLGLGVIVRRLVQVRVGGVMSAGCRCAQEAQMRMMGITGGGGG